MRKAPPPVGTIASIQTVLSPHTTVREGVGYDDPQDGCRDSGDPRHEDGLGRHQGRPGRSGPVGPPTDSRLRVASPTRRSSARERTRMVLTRDSTFPRSSLPIHPRLRPADLSSAFCETPTAGVPAVGSPRSVSSLHAFHASPSTSSAAPRSVAGHRTRRAWHPCSYGGPP